MASVQGNLHKLIKHGAAVAGMVAAMGHSANEAKAQYDPYSTKYPKAVGEHTLAMVMVNFVGQEPLRFTDDQVRQQTFEAPDSIADYYAKASFGQFKLRGEVFSPVNVSPKLVDPTCDDGSVFALQEEAKNTVEKQTGRSLAGFNNYGFTVSFSDATENCNFGGQAFGNTFINLETRGRGGVAPHLFYKGGVVHEIGHNFGLSHANEIRCHDSKGRAIPYNIRRYIVGKCLDRNYGDPIDPMGQSSGITGTPPDMSAINKMRLGWLKPENLVTMKRDGIVTISPLETQTDRPQLVRIPNSLKINGRPRYFYLDFRQRIGLDSGIPADNSLVNGVSIREAGPIHDLEMDATFGNFTNFIDTTPSTSKSSDGALTTGRTFKDSSIGITIQTLSVGPEGASVSVSGLSKSHAG